MKVYVLFCRGSSEHDVVRVVASQEQALEWVEGEPVALGGLGVRDYEEYELAGKEIGCGETVKAFGEVGKWYS